MMSITSNAIGGKFLIDYRYKDGNENIKVDGAIFDIYKIGDVENNVAKIDSKFSKFESEMSNDKLSDEFLREVVTIKPLVAVTDKEGVVTVDIRDGVYVFVEKDTVNSKHIVTKPFVVSMPYKNSDNSLNYFVKIKPKTVKKEVKIEEVKPVEVDAPKEKDVVLVDVLTGNRAVLVLCVVFLISIIGYIIVRKHE